MIIKNIPEDLMDYIFEAKRNNESPQTFIINKLREAKQREGAKNEQETNSSKD